MACRADYKRIAFGSQWECFDRLERLWNFVCSASWKTADILKRLAENSIYDLNPQSIPGRDEMDGFEATYFGADFVPQKILGDEIFY
ncbi:hypothetical protein AVEN_4726-1 [Araneus ventricosus]|uniref:Uncharacterized protein n=1 Tax=Araneus ventricosus TaxID=182803 RepID=A0A4Y2HFQ3_ARAVE|nr:hypothetical protein AVEN_4726-1 [Araneus ventricosus]